MLISILYICIFLVAVGQLRYQYLYTNARSWRVLYKLSEYAIVILDIMIIMLELKDNKWKIQPSVIPLVMAFLFFEIIVSYANNLLIIDEFIIDAVSWPLTFVAYTLYCRNNKLPKSYKYLTVIGMTLICVLSVPNIQRHYVDYGRRGGVIFPVYFTFCFLGIMLYLDYKWIHYVFMAVITAMLTVSTKRTGITIVVAGIFIYFVTNAYIEDSLKMKIRRYAGYLFVGGIILYFAYSWIMSHNPQLITAAAARFANISVDGGSNRRYIWEDIMNHFAASPLSQKIFGHGFHAVYYQVEPYGYPRLAHNSFIETLYDYGIIGLMFTVWFTFYIIFKSIRYLKKKHKSAPALCYSLIGMIFLSLFSYFYDQSMIILPYIVLWGAVTGEDVFEKKMHLQHLPGGIE